MKRVPIKAANIFCEKEQKQLARFETKDELFEIKNAMDKKKVTSVTSALRKRRPFVTQQIVVGGLMVSCPVVKSLSKNLTYLEWTVGNPNLTSWISNEDLQMLVLFCDHTCLVLKSTHKEFYVQDEDCNAFSSILCEGKVFI